MNRWRRPKPASDGQAPEEIRTRADIRSLERPTHVNRQGSRILDIRRSPIADLLAQLAQSGRARPIS